MKEFPKGMFAKKPHDKAPDFVISNISVKKDEFIAWASEKDEYINMQLLLSKDGNKHYLSVDDWKPNTKEVDSKPPF